MIVLVAFLVIAAAALASVVLMDQRAKRRRRALGRDDNPITGQLVETNRNAQVANTDFGMIDSGHIRSKEEQQVRDRRAD